MSSSRRRTVCLGEFSLSMEMSRLTRDGTAEPVSRDQILRHARGQGNILSPVQLTTSRIGNLTRLIHTLLYVMTIHTYIRFASELPNRTHKTRWNSCLASAFLYYYVEQIKCQIGTVPVSKKARKVTTCGLRTQSTYCILICFVQQVNVNVLYDTGCKSIL